MKQIIITLAAIVAATLISSSASAAEKSLKGEGVCAKCTLKETEKCQNAIRLEEGGKKVTYYLEDNDVSKAFHGKVCHGPTQVSAKGTVSEKDGKKWIKVSKIEESK